MAPYRESRGERPRLVNVVVVLAALCGLSTASPAVAATDYNNDGASDIAFHRPGSSWNSVPVLFSNGDGSWWATNDQVPAWANQPGVIAIAGDFDNDGKTDLAFIRPGSTWNSVPILFSNGDGSWRATNYQVPAWANQPGVIPIAGDFDNDGKTDLAFVRPGSTWNSVPILFSNGDGSWRATNYQVPAWANQPGVVPIAGDFDNDGKTDLAFIRPGSTWNSVPVLFSNGDGSWRATNYQVPAWANQPEVVAVQTPPPHNLSDNIQDHGDPAYDWTSTVADAWNQRFETWAQSLEIARSSRVVVVIPPSRYADLQDRLGLTGYYHGELFTSSPIGTAADLNLRDHGGEVHGTLTVLQPTLEFDGGFCGKKTMPVSTFSVRMTSTGPIALFGPERSRFDAHGSTTREVTAVGLFSGQVIADFDVSLHNAVALDRSDLFGTITIDAPWPCRDQKINVHFRRRNGDLFEAFGYPFGFR